MKIFVAALLLMVSVAAVTGCGRLKPLLFPEEPRWKPAVEEPAASTVMVPQVAPQRLEVLAYFNNLQDLTDVELEREYCAVSKRYASASKEDDRWRLIFLSILPRRSFSNRAYALELLRGIRQGAGVENESRIALGRLLSLLLADQRELECKLGEEQLRAEKLAQQMQELKDIEKILSEREKTRPAGK